MRHDWTIERTLAPTTLPVSVADIKRRLNLPQGYDHHDEKLLELSQAATEQFESETDRICMSQSFDMHIDSFRYDSIDLYKRPIVSVDEIKYLTDDGTFATLDSNVYVFSRARRRIDLAYNQNWPSVPGTTQDAVTISFTAGVTEPDQVPKLYRQAITLLVGAWFVDPADEKSRDRYKTAYNNIFTNLMQEKEC